MEDDEPGPPAQLVHDPPVDIRVVADVIDGEVGACALAALDSRDIEPLAQRRYE